MKTKPTLRSLLAASTLLATLMHPLSTCLAQGTAFTYQGRLNTASGPATGSYDLAFTLYNTNTTGAPISGTVTNTATAVSNGLFTVALDFGGTPYAGDASIWLQIGARTNGAATFSPLTPRQAVLPTPYAIYAESANATNLVGTIQAANLSAANLPGVALLGSANTFTSGNQIITGGSVGIGTASPATQLANTANNIYGSDGFGLSPQGLGWYSSIGGYTAGFYNSWNNYAGDGIVVSIANPSARIMDLLSGGKSVMAVNGNGHVGIGTNAPSQPLEVNGNVLVDATLTANNINAPTADFSSVPSASGANLFLGSAGVNGQQSASLVFNASGVMNGSIAMVSGASLGDLKSRLDVGFGESGNPLYPGNPGTTVMSLLAGGNAGIGTTTPNSPLAVYGNIFMGKQRNNTTFNQIGDTIYLGAEQKFLANTLGTPVDGSTDWINLCANPLSAGIILGLSAASTTSPHTNITPLMVIKSNGNVGIGIGATNPATALQVNGTVTATSFAGNGAGLANVALLNQQNTFAAQQTIKTGSGAYGLVVTDGTNQIGYYIAQGQCSFGTISPHALGFFVNNGFDSMDLNTNGCLGIGTSTPVAGLDVEVSAAVSDGRWSYFQENVLNTNNFAGSPNLAIFTSGAMGAAAYYAFSDARIKNVIGVSAGSQDLKTLRGIEVTDFTYKDTVAHGGGRVKKVIAQQVESAYPQAVTRTTGVVPDIYQPALEQDGWVKLATNLKVGERVKLVSENGQGIYPVLEIRDGAFRTDFTPNSEKVFVYGREVKDFRNVDYEALTTLNISATQELARKVDAQQAALTKLQDKLNQTLAEKETLLKHLAALEARDQAREDRLARLESSLEKGSAHPSYAAVNQQ